MITHTSCFRCRLPKEKLPSNAEIIKGILAKLDKEKNFSKEAIESTWKNVAGEKAFTHSRPTSLRKKVLTVRVDSSGWLQNLSMLHRPILKALQSSLGKDKISEIRFRIGEF